VLDDVRQGVDAEREKIVELVRDWTTTMNNRWVEEETLMIVSSGRRWSGCIER
jgi:hypothetical protein